MAQFMTNIPRRKIYETMLEFEDALLEMNILIYNQENFDKFLDKFNEVSFEKLKINFLKIKALILMFLENKKYLETKDFEEEQKNLVNNKNLYELVLKQKILSENLKKSITDIQTIILPKNKIENIEEAKQYFIYLDMFNSEIPRLLEKRRDEIYKN